MPQARALSTSPLVRPQAGRAGHGWAEPGRPEGVQPPGTRGSALAVLVGLWDSYLVELCILCELPWGGPGAPVEL